MTEGTRYIVAAICMAAFIALVVYAARGAT